MGQCCLAAGVVAVSLLVLSDPSAAEDHRGFGPWRLGMSKAAVRGIAEFGPYKEVISTGGLETPNAIFEQRKTNVSFIFGQGGLQKIQIWAYEGQSVDAAIDAWYLVRQYLSRVHGAVESPELQVAADANREDFNGVVRRALDSRPRGDVARLQMAPTTMPPGVSVFSSLFRHPQHGYYVFLYYQEP